MGAGICCDHAAKLYQIIDDFAWAGGNCQRPGDAFPTLRETEFRSILSYFACRCGKIYDNSYLNS
jgi:hypothetical protein